MKTSALSTQYRLGGAWPRITLGFGLLAACAQRSDIDATTGDSALASSSPSASAPAPSSRRAPGENPFGLPFAHTTAQAGDFALVPSRGSLSQAFEQEPGSQSLLYAGAHVDKPGERDSAVVWLTQQRGSVPNSLLIALPRSERASLGDVVLKTTATGSGLERAIVMSDGESESPRVRGLDQAQEGGVASGEPEETLAKGSFRVLRSAGELGTTLACRRGERTERFILVAIAGERRLGLGFAGRTLLFESSACRALPLVPRVQAGSRVFVPVAGEFVPAVVSRVEARSGRVIAKYEFAAESKDMAVGYGNVASELPR